MNNNFNRLKQKRLFLLDIDGTISLDSTLIDGSAKFLEEVNAIGGKYIFITNNSTKSIEDYVEKFTKIGVAVDSSNFLTSSYVTALYLQKQYKNDLIFVVGTKSFIQELKSFNLNVTEELDDKVKTVVVGFDNELNYKKIEKVCELLSKKDIDYIGTNPDLVCPTSFGFIPDCGAICDMIGKAVNKEPVYIGKPNPLMVNLAIEMNRFNKDETIVVGDRFYTDIACGINGGVDTAVVFTGEAKYEDLEITDFVPTYYFDTIKELYQSMISC